MDSVTETLSMVVKEITALSRAVLDNVTKWRILSPCLLTSFFSWWGDEFYLAWSYALRSDRRWKRDDSVSSDRSLWLNRNLSISSSTVHITVSYNSLLSKSMVVIKSIYEPCLCLLLLCCEVKIVSIETAWTLTSWLFLTKLRFMPSLSR